MLHLVLFYGEIQGAPTSYMQVLHFSCGTSQKEHPEFDSRSTAMQVAAESSSMDFKRGSSHITSFTRWGC